MQHTKPPSRNKRNSSESQSSQNSLLESHGVDSQIPILRNQNHAHKSNRRSHSVLQIHRSTSAASKKWSKIKVMSKVVIHKSKSNLSVNTSTTSSSSRFAYSFNKGDDYDP
jgi:hypothetical protein